MSPQEFIKKHIIDALMAEGFSEQIAKGGGRTRRRSLPADVSGEPQGAGFR